jgi:hypothetical protein
MKAIKRTSAIILLGGVERIFSTLHPAFKRFRIVTLEHPTILAISFVSMRNNTSGSRMDTKMGMVMHGADQV